MERTYCLIHVGPSDILLLIAKRAGKHSKMKIGEFNLKFRGQSDEGNLKDKENKSVELLKLGEVWGVSVANKQLAGDVTQLKTELKKFASGTSAIKVVKYNGLKGH